MKLNRILVIATVVLFALSFMSYKQSQNRAERFERGQKFLANLNPDNISEIILDKDKEHVILKREEDHFKLVSKNGYPAKNEAVNRLINSILDMELNDEIGSGDSLAKELEVMEGFPGSTHVVFKDDAGKQMVDFYIGKNAEGGQGSYVMKTGADEAIYVTSKTSYLTLTHSSLIKDEVLNTPEADVFKIDGNGYVIEDVNGALTLAGIPSGMEVNASQFGQVKAILANLKIKDTFLADDSQVRDLRFTNSFQVTLKDKTHYQLAMVKTGEKMYMKIQSGHQLDQIQLTGTESEEELKEKSKILQRVDELKTFNQFHGSWVYELSEYNGKKFFFTKNDLIQKKTDK